MEVLGVTTLAKFLLEVLAAWEVTMNVTMDVGSSQLELATVMTHLRVETVTMTQVIIHCCLQQNLTIIHPPIVAHFFALQNWTSRFEIKIKVNLKRYKKEQPK